MVLRTINYCIMLDSKMVSIDDVVWEGVVPKYGVGINPCTSYDETGGRAYFSRVESQVTERCAHAAGIASKGLFTT
jgi:hypothetical protein